MPGKINIDEIVATFKEKLSDCDICPHDCHVDRTSGETGFCRTADKPVISSYGPHYGEERELVGQQGSGTVFFTACNLACCFCQNYDISQQDIGNMVAVEKLTSIMLALQMIGCHNINLVTPTHQLPMILEAFYSAKDSGLKLPIVYNCGGYEKPDTIRMLEGIIDIYMPDFKWASNELGEKYSGIEDYTDNAKESLIEMHRQVGVLQTDKKNIAKRGLLIRHLVIPGMLDNTVKVLDFIKDELSVDSYVNIMDQYHPEYKALKIPELNRYLKRPEYSDALEYAEKIGLHRGFRRQKFT